MKQATPVRNHVSSMDRPASSTSAVCVLAEKSYFHGAAALINSLARNGFSGHVLVGYRGDLPAWARDVEKPGQSVVPGIIVRFVPVAGDWHLTNVKPQFMLRTFTEYCPEASVVWYFDADVVLKCAWSNFERWSRAGVVGVLDMAETYMPANHVFRREWRALIERVGLPCRDVKGYINGGCVGVERDSMEFLEVWHSLLEQRATEGAPMGQLLADGMPEFARMDQDLLNVAVMASTVPFSVLGTEAMENFPYGSIMAHAMMFRKPWQRNYFIDALKGFQPDRAHLAYWQYADGPIQSHSPVEWRRKRAIMRFTRWIGFFNRRSVRDW